MNRRAFTAMDQDASRSVTLRAAQAGDRQAFDRLVRPMLGNLLALARRIDRTGRGEELLQETLIRAHRGLSGFRGDASFRSWLVAILYRLAAEPKRYAGPAPLPGQVDWQTRIPDRLGGDPGETATTRDLLERVEAAMERLPVRQRTALHLRAVEGWSYVEIARTLQTSEGATRNVVLEARRKLRQRLGDEL